MNNENMLGFVIKDLSNQVRRAVDRSVFQNLDTCVSGTQGHLIGYLYKQTVCNGRMICQRDIEKEFNIKSSSVTAQLQTMEKNGLIVREAVEGDARCKQIILTEKAVRCHSQIDQKIEAFENRMAEGLTEEEKSAFLEVAKKIKKNLEEEIERHA